jgi:hypothetical protein
MGGVVNDLYNWANSVILEALTIQGVKTAAGSGFSISGTKQVTGN